MLHILKILGKGLLYIVLLPLGIAGFAVFGVYLFIAWLVMLVRAIIMKAMHEKAGLNDEENQRALEVLEASNDPIEPVQQGPTEVTYNINVNGPIPQNMNLQNPENYGTIEKPHNPELIDYVEDLSEEDE